MRRIGEVQCAGKVGEVGEVQCTLNVVGEHLQTFKEENTVEPPNKGHFGDNMCSPDLSFVERFHLRMSV